MGHDCGNEVCSKWGDGSGDGPGDEYPVSAMPQVGARPPADVAVPAGTRSAAPMRRAGVAAGVAAAGRPDGRRILPDKAARCDRASPGRWILPVILGGAAIWAWILLRLF